MPSKHKFTNSRYCVNYFIVLLPTLDNLPNHINELTSNLFLHSSFFFGPLEIIGSTHVCSLLARMHILQKEKIVCKLQRLKYEQ